MCYIDIALFWVLKALYMERVSLLVHHQCASSTWMMRRQPYCARMPTTHQLIVFSTITYFPHIYYVVECIVECWLSCWLYILSCTECTEQLNSYVPVNHALAGPNRICTWITPQKLCIPLIHKVSHIAQCLFIRPYIPANFIILAINESVEFSAPFDTFY